MRACRTSSTSTDERGFTLVELSVAMAVFLVFMAVTTPFLFRNLMQALRTEAESDLQQNARVAMRVLTRDLRQAGVLYASSEKPTGRSAVSFGVDFDGSGTLNPYTDASRPLEQLTYFRTDDGRLYRGRRQGVGEVLAQDVERLSFTMFGSNLALDRNGDGVVDESELNTDGDTDEFGDPIWRQTELANVTRVQIEMTVKSDAGSQTYTGTVWLRNRSGG